jgi:hypothetical protein
MDYWWKTVHVGEEWYRFKAYCFCATAQAYLGSTVTFS